MKAIGHRVAPPSGMSIWALNPMPPAHLHAPTDFDFMIGRWTVRHHRLNQRPMGCQQWTGFSGTSSTVRILEGSGNLEENTHHFPEGSVQAVALRSFDRATQTWAIWRLDGRVPHRLDVPVVGRFPEGVAPFAPTTCSKAGRSGCDFCGTRIRARSRAGSRPSPPTVGAPGKSTG